MNALKAVPYAITSHAVTEKSRVLTRKSRVSNARLGAFYTQDSKKYSSRSKREVWNAGIDKRYVCKSYTGLEYGYMTIFIPSCAKLLWVPVWFPERQGPSASRSVSIFFLFKQEQHYPGKPIMSPWNPPALRRAAKNEIDSFVLHLSSSHKNIKDMVWFGPFLLPFKFTCILSVAYHMRKQNYTEIICLFFVTRQNNLSSDAVEFQ